MKILIDAFGGDNSPEEVIAGTIEALKEESDFVAVLVGKEEVIKNLLEGYEYDKSRVEIINAPGVITCEEEPTVAVRRKPESSICVAFKELKENDEARAFVSAGSTGAVLVGATLKLGRIKGVNRPALCPIMPTAKGDKQVILLDSGANADCKSINLLQFALMGTVYAEALGVENPKVALLSNGTEDEKGNMLNHEVFPMLKAAKGINFVGNIEARDILSGDIDVVVCDGFAGNVAVKAIEGAIKTFMTLMKQGIYSSFKGKLGGMLLKDTFKTLGKKMDYNNHGGALFVGVNKAVIKAHGSSKRAAIKAAVLQAKKYAHFDIADKITAKLELQESGEEA
ncbi:MAG: phosphate acyltransferase PlsX [Clostridiales bacterium]|nr:phosphate acyltransferase PlsX [Clostridiales bacterium]